jgi:tetratricopeptide (TPR) repeat protein
MGMWFSLLALAAFIAGQYQEGVGYARRSMQCSPAFIGGHRTLAANLSALDQLDEARREVVETLRINPRHTVATVRAAAPFRDDAARERYLAALARAGLPD